MGQKCSSITNGYDCDAKQGCIYVRNNQDLTYKCIKVPEWRTKGYISVGRQDDWNKLPILDGAVDDKRWDQD